LEQGYARVLAELKKALSIGGAARWLSADRPVCVVVPKRAGDSWIYAVALICRELLRVAKGGRPEPRWISELSEGLKQDVEERLWAEGTVLVVNDPDGKLLPLFSKKVLSAEEVYGRLKLEMLADRLSEVFSQGAGFIVLHVSEGAARELYESLEKTLGSRGLPVVLHEPPELGQQAKQKLAEACWGFVEARGSTFDELFGSAERSFYAELAAQYYENVELAPFAGFYEGEGFEHRSLKLLALRALAAEAGARGKAQALELLGDGLVQAEKKLRGWRVDAYARLPDRDVYVEVETLYGAGDPVAKLTRTLSKFVGSLTRASEVRIVLLGLHALMYYDVLLRLREVYSKWLGVSADFYVPDVRRSRLVPLDELLSTLARALLR